MSEGDPNFSPMVHDWTDEKQRERYIFHARENYEQSKQLRLAAQHGHMEYGKWLVASMLAIHGGAIFAISNLRQGLSVADDSSGLIDAAVWHAGGIVFVMFAGFLAWLNFQFAEQEYFRRSNPAKVYRTDIKDHESRFDPITATVFGAAVFGLLSGWCFVAGLSEIFRALRAISN